MRRAPATVRATALAAAATAVLAGCGIAASTTSSQTASSSASRDSGAIVDPRSSAALQLATEPNAGGNRPFLAMIAGAHRSIDMTMYELADPQVEAALAAAAKRGMTVRVLLNGGYYSERESTNSTAYGYLSSHGVAVRYTPAFFALTHQKTITIDGRVSAIMTLNLTSEYYATTRDFAVLDSQPADVTAIEGAFNADWRDQRVTPSAGAGDLVWSPGSSTELLHLIASARSSLQIENEEMADPAITSALCAAARRGVKVQIAMTYESDWSSAFSELTGCGAQVRVYHGEHPIYIHAKVILVDNRTAFLGSENFSRGSLDSNRELGIVTSAPGIVHSLAGTLTSDFSGAAPPER
jgi:phosphatidylserine/phosphatidylglycerophosphate/cardiolipin synthase-like enzyme